ncbi:2Fe-2S iron-sulfur cluster-binding protein [Natronorubrum aibiense]|uniref:2Fe-2S iron-sulfur cluster binding domain-containing protein n=1 Tax=Natronorubrum aibiense TaxID=348826 RepID=A0A5P9P499_9EURY|nr:2Fe-2S iron-sulfur cluster-binding protein [Natronorubrum aibiense]QFU82958.1 2Fe-2S iron-sulfur cluster binding domain-containing protein [Natronorubrum aibiense]
MIPTVPVILQWRSGRHETITASPDESILEAADVADVGLPFGCRTGVCGTCTARCLEGEITHRRKPRALKPRHLADDYVLPCIATPASDCTLEVGADVRADLFENPWR